MEGEESSTLLSPPRQRLASSRKRNELNTSASPRSNASASSSSSLHLLMKEKPPQPQNYGIYALLYWIRHSRLIRPILKIGGLIIFAICFGVSMAILIPIFSVIGVMTSLMLAFAMLILFFRRICPANVYNIIIDAMNLPHAKSISK